MLFVAGAKHLQQLPHLLQRRAATRLHRRQGRPDLAKLPRVKCQPGGARLHSDAAQAVTHQVMHLTGDPQSLLNRGARCHRGRFPLQRGRTVAQRIQLIPTGPDRDCEQDDDRGDQQRDRKVAPGGAVGHGRDEHDGHQPAGTQSQGEPRSPHGLRVDPCGVQGKPCGVRGNPRHHRNIDRVRRHTDAQHRRWPGTPPQQRQPLHRRRRRGEQTTKHAGQHIRRTRRRSRPKPAQLQQATHQRRHDVGTTPPAQASRQARLRGAGSGHDLTVERPTRLDLERPFESRRVRLRKQGTHARPRCARHSRPARARGRRGRGLLLTGSFAGELNRSTTMSPLPLRVTLPDIARRRLDPSLPTRSPRSRNCEIRSWSSWKLSSIRTPVSFSR